MKIVLATIALFFTDTLFAAGQMDSQLGAGFQSKNPLSETYEGYVQAFKKAVSGPFTENDLNEVFSDYPKTIQQNKKGQLTHRNGHLQICSPDTENAALQRLLEGEENIRTTPVLSAAQLSTDES